MRLLSAALTLLCLPTSALALEVPPVAYPRLPAAASSAEGFVPDGWRIEQRLDGDLNADRRADLVLVLRQQDPRNVIEHDGFGISPLDSNPRLLAVAWSRPDGGYALAAQNHVLIPRHEYPNMSDVFEDGSGGVAIVRGTLRVQLYFFSNAGSWSTGSTTYTFRWQDRAFALIGYDSESLMRNSGETEALSINYSTGKLRRAHGSIEDDRDQVQWEPLPSAKRWTLDSVGDGAAFQPLP
jgi:hypothetical protein